MNEGSSGSRTFETAISLVQGCLIVTLQGDLPLATLQRIRQDLLGRVTSSGRKAILFDLQAIRALDLQAFSHLADTARMIRIMGAETVLVGFQPGVVSFLVDMDVQTGDLRTFRTLEDALAALAPTLQEPTQSEGADQETPDDPEETVDA